MHVARPTMVGLPAKEFRGYQRFAGSYTVELLLNVKDIVAQSWNALLCVHLASCFFPRCHELAGYSLRRLDEELG